MFEICCSLLFWMFLLFKWPFDSRLHVAVFPVWSSLCICLESLILIHVNVASTCLHSSFCGHLGPFCGSSCTWPNRGRQCMAKKHKLGLDLYHLGCLDRNEVRTNWDFFIASPLDCSAEKPLSGLDCIVILNSLTKNTLTLRLSNM